MREALEQEAKAQLAVVHLEEQIERLEVEIARKSNEENTEETDETNGLEDDDLELFKLQSKVERLKLQLTEAEDRAEVEIRRNTAKTTESQVKAEIGIDLEVSRLRHELIDAKETSRIRKVTFERQRESTWEIEQELRISKKVEVPTEDERISALRLQLSVAKEKAIFAESEVDIIRNTITTYKMLVNLELVVE